MIYSTFSSLKNLIFNQKNTNKEDLKSVQNLSSEFFKSLPDNQKTTEIKRLVKERDVYQLKSLLNKNEITSNLLAEPIVIAARQGNLDIVRELILAGACPRDQGEALVHAVIKGFSEIIDLLISNNKIHLYHIDFVIEYAIKKLDINLMTILIKHKKISQEILTTKILLADQDNGPTIVKKLLLHLKEEKLFSEDNVDTPSNNTKEIESIIKRLVNEKDLFNLKLLLNKHKPTENLLTEPIILAARQGSLDIVQELILAGACPKDQSEALVQAAIHGFSEIFDLLISNNKIHQNSIDWINEYAIRNGNIKLILNLAKHDKASQEALREAVLLADHNNDQETVQKLLLHIKEDMCFSMPNIDMTANSDIHPDLSKNLEIARKINKLVNGNNFGLCKTKRIFIPNYLERNFEKHKIVIIKDSERKIRWYDKETGKLLIKKSYEEMTGFCRELFGENYIADLSCDNGLKELSQITQESANGTCPCLCAIGYDYYHTFADEKLVEMFYLSPGNHVFLVLGRDPKSLPNDYTTWGHAAVIADPWANDYYPAHALTTRLKDYLGWHPQTLQTLTALVDLNIQRLVPFSE